jgi:putative oxidoreductase
MPIVLGWIVQRLFSTFAGGWPGTGLLIQRLLIGAILLHGTFLQRSTGPHLTTVVLPLIASVLLAIGLGTPYTGLLVAVTQLWLALVRAADPWTAIILFGLGVSLAMIGPGAWSMDARFFGRKHIEIVKR